MAEEEDQSQKTEDPTPRRLEEALKKGQVINSREVTNFLVFLALLAITWQVIPKICYHSYIELKKYIKEPEGFGITENSLPLLYKDAMSDFLKLGIVPCIIVIIMAIFSNFIQNGKFNYSLEPLIPKLEKISILKGAKRLFSMKSIIELIKGIAKIIVVGVVGYFTISSSLSRIKTIYDYEIISILKFLHSLATDLVISAAIILFFIAIADYLYQRFEYYKNLRMSRHDIKEEFKETEGNPEVKSKLKSLRAERSKTRMMSRVPEATVVITNPTHYAVALKYEYGNMAAPVVIAKGIDKVALKIKEVAKENNVAVVENPPLARELYRSVEIDEEIPLELYKAVAEIISYVYNLQ